VATPKFSASKSSEGSRTPALFGRGTARPRIECFRRKDRSASTLKQRASSASARVTAQRRGDDETPSMRCRLGISLTETRLDGHRGDIVERELQASSTETRARRRSSFAAAKRAASSADSDRASMRPRGPTKRFADSTETREPPRNTVARSRKPAAAAKDALRRRVPAAACAASAARVRSRAARRADRDVRLPSRRTTISGNARKASHSAKSSSSGTSETNNWPWPSRRRTRAVGSATATVTAAAVASEPRRRAAPPRAIF